ncbi:type II toxin-antitoxin system Phd/YefM family antitoxin [Nocardiopsis baichengensis]|uniref:type II toxin-antitoxin system Phd/YefM family antitoxin n=1 Tax=Nocardiopsis baichengensis TaxID=280240 RepID=UPI0003457DC3|nr:type II toxin-antitoxin system prevent-host-death family antitoxin [Nocardiopsis baichengensis]
MNGNADDTIGIEQARKVLGDLVDQVRYTGRRVLLTRNGRPAAWLIPSEEGSTMHPFDATTPDAVVADVLYETAARVAGAYARLADQATTDEDEEAAMAKVEAAGAVKRRTDLDRAGMIAEYQRLRAELDALERDG